MLCRAVGGLGWSSQRFVEAEAELRPGVRLEWLGLHTIRTGRVLTVLVTLHDELVNAGDTAAIGALKCRRRHE